MEQEYNWKAILLGTIPVSAVIALIYYFGIASGLINFYLVLGILAAMGITYYSDRKKRNLFTSAFIVLIVALTVHGLKNLNLL
ncbi:MAG: hypothetical protein IIC69_02210 [Nanoarchaeota archaeon]|nr:hypothetical protein [Nanoarchaeota archaeon]